MPTVLMPGGSIDRSRKGLDLSDPTQFAQWLLANGCPEAMATRMLSGEFKPALERYERRWRAQRQQRSATVPAINVIPSHEELVREMSRIDRALAEEDRMIDERNRQRALQLGTEIRASFEGEDETDEDEQDLFFDVCPNCSSGDVEVGYDSDEGEVYTRCAQCNLRALRPALDAAEISSARQRHDMRMAWKGARGY